ncbi:uncharacterized protein SOCE26_052760 [Sorangium cellulosum]|uniref:ARB-07466-like C-terminal domain-containing protein n=1 Tax=Sorangium cellulosum TaxID=56 RepID=A0A2L0EWY9_SORCE|nr:hypothetical protein [Sorangium cellulosum]AUX43821.1 uncharacterized protein SOCE26_052760 [Sorangium cellulosum]
MIAEAVIAGLVGVPRLVRWVKDRRQGAPGPDADLPVAPAYPGLIAHPNTVRRVLLEVSRELNLSPAALATVIELESGWDPRAPRKTSGTPRAGLNQVTAGAGLPGLDTPERVWAARGWSAERQLRELVLPFFSRLQGRSPSWSAFDLYKRNFLPAAAGLPLDAVIAAKDSAEPVVPGAKLTKGKIYAANPVFDGQKRGHYTWSDVERVVRQVEARAKGKWVTVGGRVVDAPPRGAEDPARPPAQGAPTGGAATAPPEPVQPSPAGTPAASIRQLLRQVDERWPRRSRASDGVMGDAAHQATPSDHNQGNAVDISLDKESGPDLDALADALLGDPRTAYVIWNRRIANRRIQGGAWRPYDAPGKNPHTRHLHLSIVPEARDDVRPWTLPAAAAPNVAGVEPLPRLLPAYRAGLIDNVVPRELAVGPYRVRVALDALSVAGVRVPVTWPEVIEFCEVSGMLPNTRAVVAARWEAARKGPAAPPEGGAPEERARAWSKAIGPVNADFVAGWPEWVLDGVEREGEGATYHPGAGAVHRVAPDAPTVLLAPVYRKATRNGAEVDLLEDLSRGCELGGPLPAWLREAFK